MQDQITVTEKEKLQKEPKERQFPFYCENDDIDSNSNGDHRYCKSDGQEHFLDFVDTRRAISDSSDDDWTS